MKVRNLLLLVAVVYGGMLYAGGGGGHTSLSFNNDLGHAYFDGAVLYRNVSDASGGVKNILGGLNKYGIKLDPWRYGDAYRIFEVYSDGYRTHNYYARIYIAHTYYTEDPRKFVVVAVTPPLNKKYRDVREAAEDLEQEEQKQKQEAGQKNQFFVLEKGSFEKTSYVNASWFQEISWGLLYGLYNKDGVVMPSSRSASEQSSGRKIIKLQIENRKTN